METFVLNTTSHAIIVLMTELPKKVSQKAIGGKPPMTSVKVHFHLLKKGSPSMCSGVP